MTLTSQIYVLLVIHFTSINTSTIYQHVNASRAEAIRLLLADNDVPYLYINVMEPDLNAWTTKYKPKMIFGQCPMLVDGDFELVQSNSILRYLGRKHDLTADNVQDKAKLDMIMDHIEDIRGAYVRMIFTNYEAGKDEYIKGLPVKFGPLEILLKKWNNQQILLKITYVDYNLFDILDIHLILAPDCLNEYPTLQAFHTHMANRPKIKAYRDTDEFKKRPVNGNGKQ